MEKGMNTFDWIDNHARQTPESVTRSVSSLANYLTGPVSSETLKARAIFTWVASHVLYDVIAFRTGALDSQSAADVLARRKSVCAGYANLVLALAHASGLDARVVSGFGKGAGNRISKQMFTQSNHAWNVVRIDGRWRLLDATWGAGYLSQTGDFKSEFNAHYFLTQPESFIYDHLPEDPAWQLLSPPITMQRFIDTVSLHSSCFRYNLRVANLQAFLIVPSTLTLSVQAPANVVMMAELQQNGQVLERSLTFTQRENEVIVTRIALPGIGRYEVTLFVKWRHEELYTSAVTYDVYADRDPVGSLGFPIVYRAFDDFAVRIFAPMQHYLRAGIPLTFEAEIPEAAEVLIYNEGVIFALTRTGTHWVGEVSLRAGQVQVAVRLPGSGMSNAVVLSYQAKESS